MMNWYMIHAGQFGYPQPEDDPYLLSTFDYSQGCRTCSVGRRQNAPVRFRKEPKVANKSFTGLNHLFGEIFLTDTAKKILEDAGITGMTFMRPVFHEAGEPLEHWYQLQPDSLLPAAMKLGGMTAERCERPIDEKTIRFIEAHNPAGLDGPFCGAVKYNPPTDRDWNVRYVLDSG
ncbi:MAG: hypothetical protein R3C97_03680 [Geminicoccaceae bacterium]